MSQNITDFFIPINESAETSPNIPPNLNSSPLRCSLCNYDNNNKKYVLPKRKKNLKIQNS
jgi:hypothetical protein